MIHEVDQTQYWKDIDSNVSTTFTEGATEVDKIIGMNDKGIVESIYVGSIKNGGRGVEDGIDHFIAPNTRALSGKPTPIDGVKFLLRNNEDSKKFIEFSYETTTVELMYTHSQRTFTVGENTLIKDRFNISTIFKNGMSMGGSVISKGYKLLYSVHTHPGGDKEPSGKLDNGYQKDMSLIQRFPSAVHQIYSGSVNGYTTFSTKRLKSK